jgi:uncharacterized repeat protein (TIGR02543 family)
VAAISAAGGTQIAKPTDPTRSGFAFTGWFNAETGGTLYAWPHTLTANVTMHAQWQEGSQPTSEQYTVTFHTSGGGSAPEPQSVAAGEKAVEPVLAAEGLYLGVITWYTSTAYTTPWDFNTPVTQNLDLYTNETPVNLDGQSGANTLAKALDYIAAQTPSAPTSYTIVLDGDYSMPGAANITTANAVVTLLGKGPSEISLSTGGSLFHINTGELVLGRNVTLKGRFSNDRALVLVEGSSASLTMKAGAKITGNSNTTKFPTIYGGGVYVNKDGSFVMEGGEISGNSGVYSGGVLIADSGSFTMSGGEISGNSAVNSDGGGVYAGGNFVMEGGKISGNSDDSGVYVAAGGSFTMSGGEISGHTAQEGGGGVLVGGSFEMSGGKISGNSAFNRGGGGGGVLVVAAGSFKMIGGEISRNYTSISSGGGCGVYVDKDGSFVMEGGEISHNYTASYTIGYSYGGGVYVNGDGNFVMKGGTISGNSADSAGGGVYVNKDGSFVMEGGEISGNDANSDGGGVYVGGSFVMSGGKITGNSISASYSYSGGGGVSVQFGSFAMESGEISGNRSGSGSYSGYGGGVFVYSGSFKMKGGKISGNAANSDGGGVYVSVYYSSSSFEMEGGEISGNSAANYGGGVYVSSNSNTSGSFNKTGGGVIHGSDAAGSLKNTAWGNTYGHGVYYYYSSGNGYYRNATLNAGDNISTAVLPGSGTGDNWTKQ